MHFMCPYQQIDWTGALAFFGGVGILGVIAFAWMVWDSGRDS